MTDRIYDSRLPVTVAAITMATDAMGSLRTVYVCNGGGWRTSQADTPPNTLIEARMTGAGRYTRSMFAGRALFGAMQTSFGGLRLSNADGALDAWMGYGFDGREIVLYQGRERDAFPAEFTEILRTETLRAPVSTDSVDVTLRDPLHRLTKPVVRETFAGTGGLEGPGTLAGQPKPRALGGTFFTPMVLVSAADLIYFVCSEASLSVGSTVYDGGVALTLGANYSTTADLLATAPSPGQARVYVGGPTYVRFGSVPAFEPTIARTPAVGSAGVMAGLAQEAGLTLHGTHITGPVMGSYVDDLRTTYLEVFVRESMQTPRWFGIDKDGLFVIREIADPDTGTSVATITQHDVLSLTRTTPDGLDVPLWKVTARGNKNHAKSKQLAGGAIAGAYQDFLSSSTDSDSAVLTKHPAAGELSIEIGNDPGSTAAAHFALHGTDRDVFRVVLDFDDRWVDLDLGDVVTLYHSRLGLSAGRKLLTIAIDLDFNTRRMALDLWG